MSSMIGHIYKYISRGISRCRKGIDNRGVSPVIGSMLMLLIVVSVGTILLTVALNNINMFHLTLKVEEDRLTAKGVIIENIGINPTNGRVTIWLRNIGDDTAHINKITIFNIREQSVVLEHDTEITLAPKQLRDVTYSIDIARDSQYKVIIGTINGESAGEYFTT